MIVSRNSLLRAKMVGFTSSNKVILFMKGTTTFPLCGLSASICFRLKKHNIDFKGVDVLQDPDLHLFLRELHSPKTMPYLYIDGKFVGGYDEIVDCLESAEGFGSLAY